MLVLVIAACSQRHESVASFEEAYVANKANDFEFSHFKFFGSDNVLILSSKAKSVQSYSGLCRLHGMNCQRLQVDFKSKKTTQQLDQAMHIIESFQGSSFLLISKDKNLKAIMMAKFAQAKYNKNSRDLKKMIQRFQPDRTEDIYQVLEIQ